MTPPLYIGAAGTSNKIDLTRLAQAMQSTPEAIYLFRAMMASTKYGTREERMGSKVQVNRLRPFAEPDPDSISDQDAESGFVRVDNMKGTPSNFDELSWSSVEIQVSRRRQEKPVAEKFVTRQLSQVDTQTAMEINMRRNYNQFMDNLIREEYRSHVCTQIFGKSLRTSASQMTAVVADDGLGLSMLREYKERAAALKLRAFGSEPGGDMQALAGYYIAITDQRGINRLLADEEWREFAVRDSERQKFIKGYFGEYDQIMVLKSDRMRLTNVGSSSHIPAHEILFVATDPSLIEPASDISGQGFVGELPIVLAEVDEVEIKRAQEDAWGEDLMYRWYQTLGIQSLHEVTDGSGDTPDEKAELEEILADQLGHAVTVAAGSSQFIHRGLFV